MKKSLYFAYISGYIDGDGCFYLTKITRTDRNNFRFISRLIITSTNHTILYDFKERFGGSVSIAPVRRQNCRPVGQYILRQHDAMALLKKIKSLLIERRDEARIFMEFAATTCSIKRDRLIQEMAHVKTHNGLIDKESKTFLNQIKQSVEPTELDYAYLAGFIDAECSLGVSYRTLKDGTRQPYTIVLQCSNGKLPVFIWLAQRFGGSFTFIDKKDSSIQRPYLKWVITSAALSKILHKIYPYLHHKKPVCKQLIKFYATTFTNGGDRHTDDFRTAYAAVVKQREDIALEVARLNKKGV